MSQSSIGFTITLPNVDDALRALAKTQSLMTNTQKAVEESTLLIQQAWITAVSGVDVTYSGGTFVVNDRTGQYMRSIQRQVPYRGRLSGIVYSDWEGAARIEKGYAPFDMKPGLLRSSKAKQGKDGSRYITVPFRHNTPGSNATGASMPKSIYNQAKKLDLSSITGRTPWGTFTYQWGGRLPSSPVGQRTKLPTGGMNAPYTWKTGQYSGMVRMGQPGGKRATGYLTFRRVSTKSDPNSWWHSGQPPKPVTAAVKEITEPSVLSIIRTGFALDLAMAGLPIPNHLR